ERQGEALVRAAVDVAGDLAVLPDHEAVEEGLADLEHEGAGAGVGQVGLGAQGDVRRGGPDALAFGRRRGGVGHARSALSGRDSRSSTTSGTVVSPASRAATASEMGMSTPVFSASSRTAGADS